MGFDQTCLFEKLRSKNLKLMSYLRTAKWPLTNGVGNFHKNYLPMLCTEVWGFVPKMLHASVSDNTVSFIFLTLISYSIWNW